MAAMINKMTLIYEPSFPSSALLTRSCEGNEERQHFFVTQASRRAGRHLLGLGLASHLRTRSLCPLHFRVVGGLIFVLQKLFAFFALNWHDYDTYEAEGRRRRSTMGMGVQ